MILGVIGGQDHGLGDCSADTHVWCPLVENSINEEEHMAYRDRWRFSRTWWCQCVPCTWNSLLEGALAVFLVALVPLGCTRKVSVGEATAGAVAAVEFDIVRSGSGPVGIVKNDRAIRKALYEYDAADIIGALQRIYADTSDPERKGRAVVTLLAVDLGRSSDSQAARECAIALARQALTDEDERVAFLGLCVLRVISTGTTEDKKLAIQRSRYAVGTLLGSALYDALWKWGDRKALLDTVFEPYPEGMKEPDRALFKLRLIYAIEGCQRKEWRGEGLPPGLGERLVTLMDRDPLLAVECCDTLVFLQAKQSVASMKVLFARLAPGTPRTVLGVAILALSPRDVEFRSRLGKLIDDLVKECLTNPDRERQLMGVCRRLVTVACNEEDSSLLTQLWEACKPLATPVRARVLAECMLFARMHEDIILALVSHLPDDELRSLLASSAQLRQTVQVTLLGEEGSLATTPRQGVPIRSEQERRLRSLLE